MHVRMKLIVALAGAVLVSACDDDDDTVSSVERLGGSFAALFSSSAMSGPLDAQSVSITPVSKTADPFNP